MHTTNQTTIPKQQAPPLPTRMTVRISNEVRTKMEKALESYPGAKLTWIALEALKIGLPELVRRHPNGNGGGH